MLKKLNLSPLNNTYKDYIAKLKDLGFLGDIEASEGARLVESTDNGIYHVIPQCVLFPRNAKDIKLSLKTANKQKYRSIVFSPRGGGTGTNGQSLTNGIMIDCSRYMNKIINIDPIKKTATIEPGVVLGQLNSDLSKYSLFFAPHVSSESRATIGGMVSTDACGKGSIIHGRTSNHIIKLNCLLVTGESLETREILLSEIENESKLSQHIHNSICQLLIRNKDEIEKTFPKMTRYMTGYNLSGAIDYANESINLNYLIAGSEGTLVYITGITVKLLDIPKYKILFLVQYKSFLHALSDGYRLLKFNPSAIETIDDNIIKLAMDDPIYYKVADIIFKDKESVPQGINLIEFNFSDKDSYNLLSSKLTDFLSKGQNIDYYCATNPSEISSLWELRKKGVGLLGAMKGNRKPIPFMEDTAVPPQYLSQYIDEIRELLNFHGLNYGMFGHVDAGCLHMRPALDMTVDKDRRLVPVVTKEVNSLVKKYHGIYWSEHGKGYRSEYVEDYFGSTLYEALRQIKYFFDLDNRMNPGKIVVPHGSDDKVVSVDGPYRGYLDGEISQSIRNQYAGAFECNGNAACLNYSEYEVMCPSSKFSRNWLHSPKGRAALLREWLRKQSLVEKKEISKNNYGSFKRLLFYFNKPKDDFSNEVYDSLFHCLGCKACASACPVKINIPEMKSKFLSQYHTRYPRSFRDYIISKNEVFLIFISKLPVPLKVLINSFLGKKYFLKALGFNSLPKIDVSHQKILKNITKKNNFSYQKAYNFRDNSKNKTVLLLCDSLSYSYNSEVLVSAYELIKKLGFNVLILPLRDSGKGYHALGFLKKFKKLAKSNIDYYNQLAKLGFSIVGVEPSLTLCFRDEYIKMFGNMCKFKVELFSEWLHSQDIKSTQKIKNQEFNLYLYPHCTEKALVSNTEILWVGILKALNLKVKTVQTGCCGMAGNYGYQIETSAYSKKIYDLSWKDILQGYSSEDIVLATGFSCRSQVSLYSNKVNVMHPIVFINKYLTGEAYD